MLQIIMPGLLSFQTIPYRTKRGLGKKKDFRSQSFTTYIFPGVAYIIKGGCPDEVCLSRKKPQRTVCFIKDGENREEILRVCSALLLIKVWEWDSSEVISREEIEA